MFGSVCLALSDNKLVLEILLADLPGLFLNPAVQPDFLDAAEIEHFEIVRISGGLVGRGSQEGAREVITVAAQIHTLCFDAIQSCTSLSRQMKMLSVFLAATSARYFFFRDTHFGMNHFSQFACQIVLIQLTIETIQPTRRC